MSSPLFGQSDDEKRFSFRTALVAHALTYNLDKQNGIGFHFGQFSTEINAVSYTHLTLPTILRV